jgi:hypothetical protein
MHIEVSFAQMIKALLRKIKYKLISSFRLIADQFSEMQIDFQALDYKDVHCREPEQDLLRYLLGPSSLALDVGANTGTYVKSILETGASCLAIECNPALCNVLQKRFSGNPNVQIKSLALSNSTGFA